MASNVVFKMAITNYRANVTFKSNILFVCRLSMWSMNIDKMSV